jgi:hypothetical protein
MSEQHLTVIVMRNTITDWLSSAVSLGMATAMSVANHRFGGGSTWVDALAVILAFIVILARVANKSKTSFRGTKDEAIEHIRSM